MSRRFTRKSSRSCSDSVSTRLDRTHAPVVVSVSDPSTGALPARPRRKEQRDSETLLFLDIGRGGIIPRLKGVRMRDPVRRHIPAILVSLVLPAFASGTALAQDNPQ